MVIIGRYRRFGQICCIHLENFNLKTRGSRFLSNQITRRLVLEDRGLDIHRHDNLNVTTTFFLCRHLLPVLSRSQFAVFAGLLRLEVFTFFFFFFILAASFSHFISRLPLLFLLSGRQLNNIFGHVLSPLHSTCLYQFNMVFSILSRTVCVILVISLMTSFVSFSVVWRSWQLFSKKPLPVPLV